VQAIKHQPDFENEGTPLAHPRAMHIATTKPSSENAPNDAPCAAVAKGKKLVATEAKPSEPDMQDGVDDAYDLACTD
jgi:hypothetical protein